MARRTRLGYEVVERGTISIVDNAGGSDVAFAASSTRWSLVILRGLAASTLLNLFVVRSLYVRCAKG
ncbi:MAG TPA: hypothetical protein VHJ18_01665 [Streptosporangiaceae bacterium]|nr:hypothetical protein [Streptosporangiaceae bacterium]